MRALLLRSSAAGVGEAPNGVYYSDDDGASWTHIPATVSPNNDDARVFTAGFVAFDHVMLAVGTDLRLTTPTALAVWASLDGGQTWARRQYITGYNLNTDELCYFDDDYQFVVVHQVSDGTCRLLRSTDKFLTYSVVVPADRHDLSNPIDIKGIERLPEQIDFEMVGMGTNHTTSLLNAAAIDSPDGGQTFDYLNDPTTTNMDGRKIVGPANLVRTNGALWLAGLPPTLTAGEDIYYAPVGPYIPSGFSFAGTPERGSVSVAGSRVPYRTGASGKRQFFLLTTTEGGPGLAYTTDGATWHDVGVPSGPLPPQSSSGAIVYGYVLPDTGTFLYMWGNAALPCRSTDHGATWANTTTPSGSLSSGRMAGLSASPTGVSRLFGAAQEAEARRRVSGAGKMEMLARRTKASTIPAPLAGGLIDETGRVYVGGVSEVGRVRMGGVSEVGRVLGAPPPSGPPGDMQQEILVRRRPSPSQEHEAKGSPRRALGTTQEAMAHRVQAKAGAQERLLRAPGAAPAYQEAKARLAPGRGASHEGLSGRRVPLAQPVHTQEAMGRIRRGRAGTQEAMIFVARARGAFDEARAAAVKMARGAFHEARNGIANVLSVRSAYQEARRRLAPTWQGGHEARLRLAPARGAAHEARSGRRRAVAGATEARGGLRHSLAGWQEVLMSNSRRARAGAQEARNRATHALAGAAEVFKGVRGQRAGSHEALIGRRQGRAGSHEVKGVVVRLLSAAHEARGAVKAARAGVAEAKGRVAHAMASAHEALLRKAHGLGGFQVARGIVSRARGAYQETKGTALQHAISAAQEARAAIRRPMGGAHEAKRAFGRLMSGAQEARRRIAQARVGGQEARGLVARVRTGSQEAFVRVTRALAGFQEQVAHAVAMSRRGGHESRSLSHVFQVKSGAQEGKGITRKARPGWLEALFAFFPPPSVLPPEIHEVDIESARPIPAGPARQKAVAQGRSIKGSGPRRGILALARLIKPWRRE